VWGKAALFSTHVGHAGGIFRTGKRAGIQGVTTAATIFATAAVGCTVGLDFQIVGVGFAIIILIILRSTQFLEVALHRTEEDEYYEEEEEKKKKKSH